MPPKVSVCTPVYKDNYYILKAVESILNQSFQDFEIILLDDGSPDNNETWNTISSINNSKIKIFKQEHAGIAGAKNACVSKSSGDLIAFCDSDDLWKPDKLKKQVEIFESNQDIDFSFTSFTTFNEEEGELETLPLKSADDHDIFLWAVKTSCIFPSTMMLRKSLWCKLKGYDTSYKILDDQELELRMAYSAKGIFLKDSLVLYRLHESNTSKSKESHRIFPIENEKLFKYWLTKKDLSSIRKKAVKKDLPKTIIVYPRDFVLIKIQKKSIENIYTEHGA